MLNVTHVFSDKTFLSETKYYNDLYFTNTIVIIGESIPSNIVTGFHTLIVSSKETDLSNVVTICSSADIVVLYELDSVKSYIALNIPQNITIAWRFFGAELYDRNMTKYLSDNSLMYNNTLKEKLSKLFNLKTTFNKLGLGAKKKSYPDNLVLTAIRRVDLFLCLSKFEYDHLIRFWKNLPTFIQVPVGIKGLRANINAKKDLVIIGNSRSIYNNHIDIISLIENTNYTNQLVFLIPFSYGLENYYTHEVRRLVSISKKNIKLLEDFIPYDSYFNLVTGAKTAIFNCYRQMAMGNIAEYIYSGVKIYLSSNNIIYHWLKDLGLKVYTIEEFGSDMESGNLELSFEHKEMNINILNHISSVYNEDKFVAEIISFENKKNHIASSDSKIPDKI